MKKIIASLCLISISAWLFSQTPTPTPSPSKLGISVNAISLTMAQVSIYKYYADNSQFGPVLTGVRCSGSSSPYECVANFPALTPGPHTLSVTGKYGRQPETSKSNVVSFQFTVVSNP